MTTDFSTRQLARDLDVVLVTRKDVEDTMLPAGDLREPLSTLREADVLVVREEETTGMHEFLSRLMRETGGRPIWQIRRKLRISLAQGERVPERPVVFCGIARPEGFFEMLAAEGIQPTRTVAFRDHQSYGEREVAQLLEAAIETGADGFVTTEKDGVKLTEAMRERLRGVGALLIPELEVELLEEKAAFEQMLSTVQRLNRRRTR